jgi:hypothetical protein
MLPNGLALGFIQESRPYAGNKKGADSSPCLVEVPPSTHSETQELEARQTAHLRASRFTVEKLAVFYEASMRVSAKSVSYKVKNCLW